jgi:hypothetical protein
VFTPALEFDDQLFWNIKLVLRLDRIHFHLMVIMWSRGDWDRELTFSEVNWSSQNKVHNSMSKHVKPRYPWEKPTKSATRREKESFWESDFWTKLNMHEMREYHAKLHF